MIRVHLWHWPANSFIIGHWQYRFHSIRRVDAISLLLDTILGSCGAKLTASPLEHFPGPDIKIPNFLHVGQLQLMCLSISRVKCSLYSVISPLLDSINGSPCVKLTATWLKDICVPDPKYPTLPMYDTPSSCVFPSFDQGATCSVISPLLGAITGSCCAKLTPTWLEHNSGSHLLHEIHFPH